MDRDAELKEAIRQAGLNPPPGPIQWDRSYQRFPAPGEKKKRGGSSWYLAFEDRDGAVFGCYKTGIEGGWTYSERPKKDDLDPVDWEKTKIRWKRKQEEVKREREERRLATARRANERWKSAGSPDPKHPYLRERKILHPVGIRQEGRLLLVPCKDPARKNQIVNLQTIDAYGRKLFLEHGQVVGTRMTLNSAGLDPKGRVYVAEGYATGWSIHQATGQPVVVCYALSNIEPTVDYLVSQYGDEHPELDIIIAADNDRWTTFHHDGQEWANPGVTMARTVAAKHEGRVLIAVPDFLKIDRRPTDFNDLWVLEGEDAVRRWALPARASSATIRGEPGGPPIPDDPIPRDPDPEPEPEAPEPEGPPPERFSKGPIMPRWMESAPFRVLGHNRGHCYYIPKGTGQVVSLSIPQHERSGYLMGLAPLAWWERHFGESRGANWKVAGDALIQVAYKLGVWLPERLRGRGVWPEDDPDGREGYLIHLGDRVLPPGEGADWLSPGDYKSPTHYTYEIQGPLKGPTKTPMDRDEAAWLRSTCRDLFWTESVSGDLLAGWVALAPLCGALDWRPHIWLIGQRGSGKSTIARDLIHPLMADMGLYVVGETTEAGIRHELQADAKPVIFDEAEETEGVGTRIQRVLALARASSSESDARTLKGTAHGSALQYRVRSMFCFASISASLQQESDKSRVCVLQLKGASEVEAEERQRHWARYQPKLSRINERMGRRLLARQLILLRSGELHRTIDRFREAAAVVMSDQRLGDQYGTLMAGAYLLSNTDAPSADVARELIASEDFREHQAENYSEGERALSVLTQHMARVQTNKGPLDLTIGQMLVSARPGATGTHGISQEEAKKFLGQRGLKVDQQGERSTHILWIANDSTYLKSVFRGMSYARSWRSIFKSLPGAKASDNAVYFIAGHRSRAVGVPLHLVEDSAPLEFY